MRQLMVVSLKAGHFFCGVGGGGGISEPTAPGSQKCPEHFWVPGPPGGAKPRGPGRTESNPPPVPTPQSLALGFGGGDNGGYGGVGYSNKRVITPNDLPHTQL